MFSLRLCLVITLSVIVFTLAEEEPDTGDADPVDDTLSDGPYIPGFLRRKYGTSLAGSSSNQHGVKGGTKSVKGGRTWNGPGTKTGFSGVKGGRSRSGVKGGGAVKNGRINAAGGSSGACSLDPAPPMNGRIECSSVSGCRATCSPRHLFPNGKAQLMVNCQDGTWKVGGTEWETVSTCLPTCLPECQNNGICVAPNQCNCQDNYSGPQCQFKNEPCLNNPPLPYNARRRCSSKSCTITCAQNHTFPDGSSIANLVCKNGNWVPTKPEWVSIPDCQAVCSPACENGGNCLSLNVCQCPAEFRGPQCQYSVNACDVEKIGFNGGYNCTGDRESFACELQCPEGIEYEFPPASTYTCLYSEGIFKPRPIPQCKFESNMEIIPIGGSRNSYFENKNQSWSTEDLFGSISGIERIDSSESGYGSDLEFGSGLDHSATYGSGVKKNYHSVKTGNSGGGQNGVFKSNEDRKIIVEQKHPEPAVCFTWGGIHYKTFDGKIFSFESDCAHTLVRDAQDGLFAITLLNSPGCLTGDACFRIVKIFIQGKEYTLQLNDDGIPEFRTAKKALPIPVELPVLRVEMTAHFMLVTLDSIGASLKWDGALLVQVQASESLWNKTTGLCGNMNGYNSDDLKAKDGSHPKSIATLASSWRAQNIGETCDETPNIQHSCIKRTDFADEASAFCSNLLADRRFQVCSSVIDLGILQSTCKWDYCACKQVDRRRCACDTMSVYVRQCAYKGIVTMIGWRDNSTCPMKCTGGRVYMSCGPKTQASCGAGTETKSGGDHGCEEGCFCPIGSVLYDGRCISPEECPCKLRGKVFHPGSSISKDCNTCTCSSGKWICTEAKCSARCAAIGDPHYVTFDGKHYDFMGKCTYYLVKGDNYSIEGENVACPGAVSQNLGFVSEALSEAPSCTKTVTIRVKDITIKLKQNRQLSINGEEITKLPIMSGGVKVRVGSSIFLIAELSNGMDVWWDGISRVYINAPADFHGKTKGLCGTFTMNQKDDFATPDGDIEQSIVPFANKWKTDETCPNAPQKEPTHPCELNPQKKAQAETYCSKLHSQLFSDCHWHVDPESFYKDCMYDMCACETDISRCLCPILAAYAKECSHQGLRLSWRLDVEICKVHCPAGQEYQICGNSCTRSCGDISFNQKCKRDCVEGCNCPEGQTLDEQNECVPIGQCPCQHAGLEFKAGYREVRPGTKSQELCTCAGGVWNCNPATPDEIRDYPSAADLKSVCSVAGNQELSTCKPIEPKTCRNMHTAVTQNPAICKPGCICKKNYVLDVQSSKCVKETECPCYHGGNSYAEGSSMQEECNTCKCNNGQWNCTDRICEGVCSAWGDSHYTTFDGKSYEFQGVCDYVLAKGSLSPEEVFDISTQNVPCGTTGVTCSKSITLVVGAGDKQESITLTRGKELPKVSFNRIAIRKAGLFVFLDVPDLGLVLQWDEGTRIYVRLSPKWQGRTKGLCGDYNDNAKDDFKTPSGGISEVSANLFGDSWKKQSYCPESKEIIDTCAANPERRIWAVKKCGVLKSSLFQDCHSEVEVEPYLERCIFDTCGCDVGGDCECLCTALAAYAQECNVRGVPVKWRSQKLCPIQCDESCSTYSPCISTCPRETCDNLVVRGDSSHLCGLDTCVEGCLPKACPEGQIYQNASYNECVPKAICKPACLTVNETTYYEGDQIESDECHSCFCSRGKKICQGQPCTTTSAPITTVPMEEQHDCIDGWTAWINRDLPVKTKKVSDVEPLPTTLDLLGIKGSAVCTKDLMVDIKCRSVTRHLTPKETGLNVECSLERGLYCDAQSNGKPCIDFEISVLCQCAESTRIFETTPEITTTEMTTTTTAKYLPCDVEHPNQAHPRDCHAFYHCVPGLDGPELVEKTCGPDMLYNPINQICDWPAAVILQRPECYVEPSTTVTPEPTTARCKNGEVWSECAVQCSRACQYYQYLLTQQGVCDKSTDCVPGCVPVDQVECPAHQFWRDAHTCVDIGDCTCKTHDNKAIKPGVPVKETECELCQCLRNVYNCDDSICESTTLMSMSTTITTSPTTTTTPTPTTIEVYTTVTAEPSVLCDESDYTYLINGEVPLSDEAFEASSYPNSLSKPSNARLYKTVRKFSDNGVFNASSKSNSSPKPSKTPLYRGTKKSSDGAVIGASNYSNSLFETSKTRLDGHATEPSDGAWIPAEMDNEQWISVDFGSPETVYGIILQGSPSSNQYVETYNVYYSPNSSDVLFIPVTAPGSKLPKVFHGPHDKNSIKQAMLDEPVVAQKIKIKPQTWHNGIAVRFEVIGCTNVTSSERGRNETSEPHLYVDKSYGIRTLLPIANVTTTPAPTRITDYTFIVPSQVPVLDECGNDNYREIIINSKPNSVTFDASSELGPNFSAENAKLENVVSQNSGGSWAPASTDEEQWLDIKLPQPEPIYGIILQGSPLNDNYVTSYKVLYSEDGVLFSYIVDDNEEQQIFSGSVNQNEPVVQIFYHPIEAKVIRINPQTWHNDIAIRVELIGCWSDSDYDEAEGRMVSITDHGSRDNFMSNALMVAKKPVKPVCDARLGLDDGIMSDEQVSASSTLGKLLPNLRLSGDGIWRPTLDNRDQYVEFDFYEPRNLTGVETKGYDNIWTTSYKVLYSHNGRQWNPVTAAKSTETKFIANYDDKKSKINYFDRPIQARYLRIQPIKWHGHVGLKAEIRGCFLPYPVVTIPTFTEPSPTLQPDLVFEAYLNCNVCEGIPKPIETKCKCNESSWWDGVSCGTKQECPCVIGHMQYPVGALYETEDCKHCICTIGGVPSCHEKKCDPCKTSGFQSVRTELCSCVCKPCPEGTRLCPTSNICINETHWCNGVEDCPDDEKDCTTTVMTTTPIPTTAMPTTPMTTTTTMERSTTLSIVEATRAPCVEPSCPPGYKVVLKAKRYSEADDMLGIATSRGVKSSVKGGVRRGIKGVKGRIRSGVKGGTKGGFNTAFSKTGESRLHNETPPSEIECPQFSCISTKPPPIFNRPDETSCPKIQCPPNYKLIPEKMNMNYPEPCPRYLCKPPPPTEAVCNVTGRTFNTFDNLEYKYDICNHVLARDLHENNWYITLEKRCNKFGILCEKVLAITFDYHVLILYPDMHVDIDQYTFLPHQVKRMYDKNKAFKITRIGDALHFVSYRYGFWVIWNINTNTRIGVTTKLVGHIDGLCGYFDGITANDKQNPDGQQVRTTVDFGNSWAVEDSPECEPQVCPKHVQEEAWNICNTVKHQSLAVCSGVLDLEKFVSRCLETTCGCLRGNLSAVECRCRELTTFVSECQAADPNIDLSTWRTVHDCPASCPAPLVHKDCFRYKCESSCDNLQETDPCPIMPGVCFSGCFCPDGTVRRGDECILPTECRDCICDGFGNSKFVSFDRKNFTFNGNCTYVLSKNIENNILQSGNNQNSYQVLVTNKECPAGVCTEAVTIIYDQHSIQITQGVELKELQVLVDGTAVDRFPYKTDWLTLEEAPGKDITLLIPAIQLEIASFQHNFAFMLRLPSHTYGGAMEGLCGDCNLNPADDIRRSDGKIVNDSNDFGNSWLAIDAPFELGINIEDCTSRPEKECVPSSFLDNPCDKLLDEKRFGQCHKLVDPEPFLATCHKGLCDGVDVCDDLEAYARSCLQAGLCPSWRTDELCPYKCPEQLEYRPCGPSCQETCSEIEAGQQIKCPLSPTEGCFCPEDKILVNGTCVSKKQCLVCDKDGHIEGDVWYPNKCTTCHCERKVITCETKECPAVDTVCSEGLTPILVSGTNDECCPKYICIPVTTTVPTCIEQQQPVCGIGQVMKSTTGADGCQKFICECVPLEECEPFESNEKIKAEPGMVQVTNTSGCCPWSSLICKPETCPEPSECPEFYESKSIQEPGQCCARYECKLEPDVCLYVPKSISGVKATKNKLGKRVGEKWQDGPCTSCKCEKVGDSHEANCITTECAAIETHPDVNHFVLKAVLLDNQCCPTFNRKACKDNNDTYAVGDEWQPDLTDACSKIECINDTTGVQKQIKLEACDTKCELGYEYKESENKGAKCCGQCIPVGCVVNGELKNIGEEWHSEDHCTNYFCLSVNGSLQVQGVTETCKKVDPHDIEEFEMEARSVEGQCCPEYVKVACRYNGRIYKPGEKWLSSDDACVTEMCVTDLQRTTKKQERKTCTKQCILGWEYQEPERGACCGECKQVYCVDGDMLYEPNVTWTSADNCTRFECQVQADQFIISSASESCPDVTTCAPESIYRDGCCDRCNITLLNQLEECSTEEIPSNNTVGILMEQRGAHGLCKNLNPIEGLTECHGKCKSSTYFDTATLTQESNCHCCSPQDYKGLIVELTCEDGKKVTHQLTIPKSCTCEPCLSAKTSVKGSKTVTKTKTSPRAKVLKSN